MSLSFQILKNPDFRYLVGARMFCHMGLQALAVIVGWQIYTITKSEFLLGLIGLTEAIPAIISALFSGYAVDISTPRRVYRLCVATLCLNLAALYVLGAGVVPMPHDMLVPLLFVGVFISGIARSFMMPAYFSITPQIVDRKDYSSASAWANTAVQTAVMTGPVLAGMVYGFMGVGAAWVLPVTFMTLGFLCVLNINPKRHYEKVGIDKSALGNIVEGWKFVITHRMLLTVMAVDMFAVLFGGAVAMLPAFASEILHVGPEGLGILRTAPAFGAILAALYFALRPMQTFPLTRMLWSVAAFGVCMIGFGLSTSFLLSVVFLAFSGLFDTISVVIRTTLKQILTPDHMRGRVSGISFMFVISSNEIGAFESGTAARLMGLVPSVVFGGVMTLFVVGITYFVTPNLRHKLYSADSEEEKSS
ncbi:MAG TPA: MFS transporter [Alphaproteobacteria bacterium]|nr:MFS transporter [Alphaproteobacteria bacterium]